MGRAASSKQNVQAVRNLMLRVLVEVSVAVESKSHGRMAGPYRNLLGVGAGSDPERNERVSELVEFQTVSADGVNQQQSSYLLRCPAGDLRRHRP
jgi:hypothetical protein